MSDLSEFLRNILYTDEPKIKLRQELLILKNYLDILEARFGDHLQVEKRIEAGSLKYKVPSMVLQPLIENVVKHGYSPQHKRIVIEMRIKVEHGRLLISIENNGKPLKPDTDHCTRGVGLSNIKERLITLYGKDFKCKIANFSNKSGVFVHINIPTEL